VARLARVATLLLIVGAAGYGAFVHWRTKNVSTVQRGWTVAYDKGCFTCHGPGGIRGMPDPGHGLGDVPAFDAGLITMYAKNDEEIREWILDGMPKRVRGDPEQMKLRADATIRMPAWRGAITSRELDDLVAFVKAASDFEKPDDPKAAEGHSIASRIGCFNCHGPQGRGSMPNVRAFKGYIPSWDGADFPELAQSDAEIRLWILDGGAKRLYANPFARWFFERQPIKMPAYRGQLTEAEVDRIVDYIHWLRRHPY
jgi:mono/diheme cytochrome c family protein